jgi:hypothetical protein
MSVPVISEDLEVRILQCRPGDVVVLSAKWRLTMEEADMIRQQASAVMPEGVKAMVLADTLELDGVVRPAPQEEGTA